VKPAKTEPMRLPILVSLFFLLSACGDSSAPPGSSSQGSTAAGEHGESLGDRAKSTLESAERAFLAHKDEFVERSKVHLEDLERRIDELEKQASTAREEARPELERLARELEGQRVRASEELARWKEQGQGAWQSFSSGVESTLHDLDRKVGEALGKAE
jgi:hypothetical protein